MFWDFLSLTPESIHQVTILFSDRGTPRTLPPHERLQQPHLHVVQRRTASTSGSSYHFKTEQGIQNFTRRGGRAMRGSDPDHATRDLLEAIARGEYPSWRLEMQIMTARAGRNLPLRPFDITKVWPHADYPPIDDRPHGAEPQSGELLRRGGAVGLLPRQLRPRHRAFAGQDAAGAALQLPRHAPPPARRRTTTCCRSTRPRRPMNSYQRDGAMRSDGNGGGGPELLAEQLRRSRARSHALATPGHRRFRPGDTPRLRARRRRLRAGRAPCTARS